METIGAVNVGSVRNTVTVVARSMSAAPTIIFRFDLLDVCWSREAFALLASSLETHQSMSKSTLLLSRSDCRCSPSTSESRADHLVLCLRPVILGVLEFSRIERIAERKSDMTRLLLLTRFR